MRAVAHRRYEAVGGAPFHALLHDRDPLPYFNYAIPDGPGAALGDLAAPWTVSRESFTPAAVCPASSSSRVRAGPRGGSRGARVRAGEPGAAHGLPARKRARLDGGELDVARLDAATPLGEFVAFLDVQRRAFGFPSARLPSDEEARQLRETLGDGFAFLGRIAGEPVATAIIQPAHDGLTELVGVSTLEAFRRRSIGGFLSWAAVRAAFVRGAHSRSFPRPTRAPDVSMRPRASPPPGTHSSTGAPRAQSHRLRP